MNIVVFAHQSRWQANILRRYGNVVLMDATYKTTVYDLPLFMLSVKTNCGYVVIGSFIVPDEQATSIKAGLQVISSWCPDWQPAYVLSDYCEAQISALEYVFPGKSYQSTRVTLFFVCHFAKVNYLKTHI